MLAKQVEKFFASSCVICVILRPKKHIAKSPVGLPVKGRPRQADAVAVRSNLSTGSKTSRQDSHCCFKECGRSKSHKRGNYDRRRTPRESPLAFGALAAGTRDRPKTARTTPVAGGRRLTLDLVQAQAAGAAGDGCGLCMCHLRTGGSLRGGFDARPRPMRGA